MIRLVLATALLLAAATPALAADERLVARAYDPDAVVRIEGRLGVQASIAFGEDEHIDNVAVGDSASWQITPNKRANLLFVKPLSPRARTNMTVVTDRRAYYFDLVASPTAKLLYVLRFTYPDEPNKDAPQLASGLAPAEAQAVAEAPVDPAQLNFAWKPKGSGKLLPARIYDDGQATYLAWALGAAIPAILVRNDKGAEGPVNFAVRDDVIVIDGVPSLIVLRAGKDSATIQNHGAPRPRALPVDNAPALAAASSEGR
jgi:type IV secretion system protein VirB9